MGGSAQNPLVRVRRSMRKDAIYCLHMPWENTWLAAPTRYAAIRSAQDRRRDRQDINVTLGGCAFLARRHLDQRVGEAKNALRHCR